MEGLRVLTCEEATPQAPCIRCQATGCPWDRIAGKPMCPDCQEQLILGGGPPLVEKVEKRTCVICQHNGTLRYVTYPLHAARPVELDLCSLHYQSLLGRRLDGYAIKQLTRLLQPLGIKAQQLFLLHEAFYDEKGRALQPVPEMY
jgi:hypothetical protein